MDTLLIAIAFLCGLLARQFNLPPLVGFLIAGFALRMLGQTGGEVLDTVSEIGVTLMLFAIGLKLRIKGLLRPEVWAGTSLHVIATVVFFGGILVGVALLLGSFGETFNPWSLLLLAFALSFSSTVFAVKVLEENGEMNALHGRTTIGILIMQDLIAVAFLTFSLGKVPSPWAVVLVAALIIGRPIMLLTRFKLRARSAFISALNLSTFSEFGLIVVAVGSERGWISGEWLVAEALCLSLSFLIAAPVNRRAESLYNRLHNFLRRFELEGRHPDDLPVRTVFERIAIFGMGRVGLSAYKYLSSRFPGRVIGFDLDPAKVAEHQAAGRNVVVADATDSDFWQRVQLKEDIDLVVLAMPKHAANRHAAETLQRTGYQGVVAATATFDDEVKELRAFGVDSAFNLYNEAGAGFARDVARIFREKSPELAKRFEADA